MFETKPLKGGKSQLAEHRKDMTAKPRDSRKGFGIPKWPLEDLAKLKATELESGFRGEAYMNMLRFKFPNVAKDYLERTGRPLTWGIVSQRLDRGGRYKEENRYKHLIADYIKEM